VVLGGSNGGAEPRSAGELGELGVWNFHRPKSKAGCGGGGAPPFSWGVLDIPPGAIAVLGTPPVPARGSVLPLPGRFVPAFPSPPLAAAATALRRRGALGAFAVDRGLAVRGGLPPLARDALSELRAGRPCVGSLASVGMGTSLSATSRIR